ncbi:hypothetical protein AB0942_13745 [Streptomyces nodosus]|uniref:hypothetical protein n=1 Tax=Streptomyces nodosus TaxID=40318 RepID=UPI00345566C5
MSQDRTGAVQGAQLEKDRARYGLLAVIVSNLVISGVAIFGVWRLDGDKSVMIGVLTAAFTAMSGLTTAYLGIKAVSNTAQSMAQRPVHPEQTKQTQPAPSLPQQPGDH